MKRHKWAERNHEILLAFSMLIVCLAIVSTSCYIPRNARRKAIEGNCLVTLRTYGETQLAYQNTNNDHHWGSWQALQDTAYIASSWSRSNLIEGYSVWTNVSNHGYRYHHGSTFTVLALPRRVTPPGYLRTFAIREDQVIRAYMPQTPGAVAWGMGGDFGAKTWEPIRPPDY